ncbi:hypothetical protein HOY80DRAFT_1052373 [Tuber brumale]|nr:hypothetical protein HOY80DRAFT_1052373 [Tuber brumale]
MPGTVGNTGSVLGIWTVWVLVMYLLSPEFRGETNNTDPVAQSLDNDTSGASSEGPARATAIVTAQEAVGVEDAGGSEVRFPAPLSPVFPTVLGALQGPGGVDKDGRAWRLSFIKTTILGVDARARES